MSFDSDYRSVQVVRRLAEGRLRSEVASEMEISPSRVDQLGRKGLRLLGRSESPALSEFEGPPRNAPEWIRRAETWMKATGELVTAERAARVPGQFVLQKDFASMTGRSDMQVSQLKAKGLLVMTADDLVDVQQSLERIESGTATAVSQAEFARLHGWAKSYVTALKQQGRLVMRGDLVDIERSLERIKATTTASSRADPAVMGPAFGDAKDRNEHYTAELARLKFEREIGALCEWSDVERVVADVAARLRAGLETLAERMAPEIATLGGDEARIRAVIADHHHAALAEMARGFAAMAAKQGT